jgi:hypothetical protein
MYQSKAMQYCYDPTMTIIPRNGLRSVSIVTKAQKISLNFGHVYFALCLFLSSQQKEMQKKRQQKVRI